MDRAKIRPTHLSRSAYVYVRQSSPHQVAHHLESQQRQYELTLAAADLGWADGQIIVIDDDQARSASGCDDRAGFERLVSDVALGRAGLILGIEVSRLARNSRDWHALLDFCAIKDTLIGDADGVYDLSAYNDRLLLGLKGTLSEAELHLIKSRMLAGMRHKAAKGELKFTLPSGYEFDDTGAMVKTSDEQVAHFVELLFTKMLELRSVSGVYQGLLHEGLRFPRRERSDGSIRWERPYYRAVYLMLTNPIYAGTYAWGRSEVVREIDQHGAHKVRQRRKAAANWDVVLHDHHPAYISRDDFDRIQQMIERNRPAAPDEASTALRGGRALLQGIVRCGHCGRPMTVRYRCRPDGRRPSQYCCVAGYAQKRGKTCQTMGGQRIEAAVVRLFLEAMSEGQLEIHLAALRKLSEQEDEVVKQLELQVERAGYEAARIERQYNCVEPENRVVARTLERRWNEALERVQALERRLADRKRKTPVHLTGDQEAELRKLVGDLPALWVQDHVTDRDRKALLRAVIEEVQLCKRDRIVGIKVIWKGGAVSETSASLIRLAPPPPTPPDVVDLVRELATRHTDAQIARILARRGIKTAKKQLTFNAHRVAEFRFRYGIACCQQPAAEADSQTYTAEQAAKLFGVSLPTIYSWLKLGILVGEQVAACAPWSIVVTEADRRRLGTEAPPGWRSIDEAATELGVSKQTILSWVKAQKVPYVYATRGRRRGLRIDVNSAPQRRQGRLLD